MRRGLVALVLAAALTGCAGDGDDPGADPTTTPTPTQSRSDEPTTKAPEPEPSGGTADDPASAEETTALLDWKPVPGSVDDTATVSGRWTLTYPERATEAVLDGPKPVTIKAPTRYRINDALIDGEYAVVVAQDGLETKPNVATVIDLQTGDQFTVDGSSDVPTTTGGTWALGEGTLLHATLGQGRSYCLASVDLATRKSQKGYCASPRQGFNDARITPFGTSLLTFDDGRPSCRTVAEVTGTRFERLPGVTECKGWDSALLDDGAVWSVVPKENRIESARLLRAGRRGLLRPRPRHLRQPDAVRRRGVLRARPAARRRPGPAHALVAGRRADRRLRDREGRPGHPRPHRVAAATRSRSPR